MLNSDNWHSWKRTAEASLRAQNLWGYVEGRVEPPEEAVPSASQQVRQKAREQRLQYDDKNSAAASFISSHIELTGQDIITDDIKGDPKACWAAVSQAYGRMTIHQLLRIRQSLNGVKYVDGASMQDHLAFFYETQRQLVGTGMAINDMSLAALLMFSVPASFESMLTSLSSSSGYEGDGLFTAQRIRSAFLNEDQRRRTAAAEAARTQETVALYHRQASNRTAPSPPQQTPSAAATGAQETRPRATCTHCGGGGHLHTKCFILHPDQAPAGWRVSAARARWAAENVRPQQALISIGSGTVSLGPRNDFDVDGFALVHTLGCGSSGEAELAFVASTGATSPRPAAASVSPGGRGRWEVDSAATFHYCLDRSWFSSYQTLPVGDVVFTGGNHAFPVIGVGSVRLQLHSAAGNTLVTLNNVRHAPGLTYNLISVRSMDDMGAETLFGKGRCIISFPDGKTKVTAERVGNSRLYSLWASVITTPSTPANSTALVAHAADAPMADRLRLWHERFGHVNTESISQLFEHQLVTGIDCSAEASTIKQAIALPSAHCASCAEGKSHKQPFPKGLRVPASRPLELLHTDICGPLAVRSRRGFHYFVTVKDDCTSIIWVRALVTKDQATLAVRDFIVWAERQFSSRGRYRVQQLRSDGGGEYTSDAQRAWLGERGIELQRSAAYSPEQNGVAERVNRTLMDLVRTMLLSTQLPHFLWADLLQTAVHVRNRSMTRALTGMTPYEAWNGVKPDISLLRAIGSLAYAHVPRQRQHDKLNARAIHCAFIGYSAEAKAWLLWDPKGRVVIESRNVHFEERLRWHNIFTSRSAGRGAAMPGCCRQLIQQPYSACCRRRWVST